MKSVMPILLTSACLVLLGTSPLSARRFDVEMGYDSLLRVDADTSFDGYSKTRTSADSGDFHGARIGMISISRAIGLQLGWNLSTSVDYGSLLSRAPWPPVMKKLFRLPD